MDVVAIRGEIDDYDMDLLGCGRHFYSLFHTLDIPLSKQFLYVLSCLTLPVSKPLSAT
jgi:hypothetical protein